VLFREIRIGRDGKPFTMLKPRSMYAYAEQRLAEVHRLNDHEDGVLFKLRNDCASRPSANTFGVTPSTSSLS
jgi:lipopolysaccharide/colanic/teichoic acid biosynthesis glycosyltransferase